MESYRDSSAVAHAAAKGQCVADLFGRQVGSDAKSLSGERAEWIEGFDQDFWPSYPNKQKRPRALRAWLAVKPWSQQTLDAIMDGLDLWIRHWREQQTERRFIPHPASFLNGRQWEDRP